MSVASLVETEHQFVVIVDIPVDTGQEFQVVVAARIVGVGTWIVAIVVFQFVVDLVEDSSTGIVRTVFDDFRRFFYSFSVDEEEQLVFHDRTADSSAIR